MVETIEKNGNFLPSPRLKPWARLEPWAGLKLWEMVETIEKTVIFRPAHGFNRGMVDPRTRVTVLTVFERPIRVVHS
jgi:hypothetical protein